MSVRFVPIKRWRCHTHSNEIDGVLPWNSFDEAKEPNPTHRLENIVAPSTYVPPQFAGNGTRTWTFRIAVLGLIQTVIFDLRRPRIFPSPRCSWRERQSKSQADVS